MAPPWMQMAKVSAATFSVGVAVPMPITCWATSRWPVELTGRYSVMPSMMPRMSACQGAMMNCGEAGERHRLEQGICG